VYKLMPILSNSPQEATVIEAEARKSFAFGVWITDSNDNPTDIVNTSTTFTVAKFDKYGIATVMFSKTFDIRAAAMGYMSVSCQASDLDLKIGTQ
jgi:hypothetical protein